MLISLCVIDMLLKLTKKNGIFLRIVLLHF